MTISGTAVVEQITRSIHLAMRRQKPYPASTILRALAPVDPVDRAALVLRDVAALSIPEVAAVLDLPEGEAVERAHRARLAVARAIHSAEAAAA